MIDNWGRSKNIHENIQLLPRARPEELESIKEGLWKKMPARRIKLLTKALQEKGLDNEDMWAIFKIIVNSKHKNPLLGIFDDSLIDKLVSGDFD